MNSEQWKLLFNYGVYVLVIVVGIFILLLFKKKNRLPNHIDIDNRLTSLLQSVQVLISGSQTEIKKKYDFLKKVSSFLYQTNKLIYQISLVAEKEQDGDIEAIVVLLEEARIAVSSYKFGLKDKADPCGFEKAIEKLQAAKFKLKAIIERDIVLKARKAK